jgi:hypothetical protein
MTKLSETAYYTRKIIKFGVIGIIAFFALRIFINTSIAIYKKLNPPPPPPPTVDFGKISRINFPTKEQPNDLSYNLQTPSGELPQFSDRAKVYYMPYQRPNLLALERAKREARQMGYTGEPRPVTDKIYRWEKRSNATSTLEMNIFTGAFKINYDWQNDQNIFLNKNLPGKQQAKIEAQTFLRTAGLNTEDLTTDKAKVSYLKAQGNRIAPAVSLSEADFVKVEMFRADVDEKPVLTKNAEKGVITFIFTDYVNASRKIIKVDYNYFPVNYEQPATYPIKTADTAWKQLQNGQGFIANWEGDNKQITIRRVYIGYFDGLEPQDFLQPIAVFEGDNDFYAYVPIITDQWYK